MTRRCNRLIMKRSYFIRNTSLFTGFLRRITFPITFILFIAMRTRISVSITNFIFQALLFRILVDFFSICKVQVRKRVLRYIYNYHRRNIIRFSSITFTPSISNRSFSIQIICKRFFFCISRSNPVTIPPTMSALFSVTSRRITITKYRAFRRRSFRIFPLRNQYILRFICRSIVRVNSRLFGSGQYIIFLCRLIRRRQNFNRGRTIIFPIRNISLLIRGTR